MTYSIDLRKRVVEFVQKGGSKAEASRRYQVSLWCVNDWCKRNVVKIFRTANTRVWFSRVSYCSHSQE